MTGRGSENRTVERQCHLVEGEGELGGGGGGGICEWRGGRGSEGRRVQKKYVCGGWWVRGWGGKTITSERGGGSSEGRIVQMKCVCVRDGDGGCKKISSVEGM